MPPDPAPPMPPTRIGRARALAPGVSAGALLAALAEATAHAEVLKLSRDGRGSVLGLEIDASHLVAKTLALDSPKRRVQAWLGWTQLDRQARASSTLRAAGIPAAEAVAVLTGRDANGRAVRTLLSRRVEGATLLAWCRRGTVPRELAERAGSRVTALARAGLHDRDLKPSNLVVREHGGGLELVAVDPVGVRRRRPRPERMLASLYIEPSGSGCAPSLTACARACRACARGLGVDWRLLFGASVRVVRAHKDPTPRDAV